MTTASLADLTEEGDALDQKLRKRSKSTSTRGAPALGRRASLLRAHGYEQARERLRFIAPVDRQAPYGWQPRCVLSGL